MAQWGIRGTQFRFDEHDGSYSTHTRRSSQSYTGDGLADSDAEEIEPVKGTDTRTRGQGYDSIAASVGFMSPPTPQFEQYPQNKGVAPGPQTYESYKKQNRMPYKLPQGKINPP
eukprot:434284-Rhodomonas_salina.1